jgi:hypothetical protein
MVVKNNKSLEEEYESRMKTIKIFDKANNQEVNLPVCYAKCTTHIRKPVKRKEDIDPMLSNTIECSTCTFFKSATELTKIDLMFSQLLVLRDIKELLVDIKGLRRLKVG